MVRRGRRNSSSFGFGISFPQGVEQGFAVELDLLRSHALDLLEGAQVGGGEVGDEAEGLVVADDVGGEVLFAREARAGGAEAVEAVGGVGGEGRDRVVEYRFHAPRTAGS